MTKTLALRMRHRDLLKKFRSEHSSTANPLDEVCMRKVSELAAIDLQWRADTLAHKLLWQAQKRTCGAEQEALYALAHKASNLIGRFGNRFNDCEIK